MIPALAIKSLRNRKFTAALTVLSITLAVVLLLGGGLRTPSGATAVVGE